MPRKSCRARRGRFQNSGLRAAEAVQGRAVTLTVEVLVAAREVSPDWCVRMQAAFQRHVDNALLKTVNLSASAWVKDVDRVLCMAFTLRCEGTCLYRD
ncbi:MAG: hypothetical protein JSU86_02305 [Phycisphaerales bacterium]|nr:MAG: hypothetical protein JSU86_02305 [Phycisphaerales bacterium]